MDFTQVTQVSANTFNVVLVRDPYATVYVGDIVAVRVPTSAMFAAHGLCASRQSNFADLQQSAATSKGFAFCAMWCL